MARFVIVALAVLALAVPASAAAGPYPTEYQTFQAVRAVADGPCGDGGNWTCNGIFQSEAGCQRTIGNNARVCDGYYTESKVWCLCTTVRYCWFQNDTRAAKLANGAIRVIAYRDSCHGWQPT